MYQKSKFGGEKWTTRSGCRYAKKSARIVAPYAKTFCDEWRKKHCRFIRRWVFWGDLYLPVYKKGLSHWLGPWFLINWDYRCVRLRARVVAFWKKLRKNFCRGARQFPLKLCSCLRSPSPTPSVESYPSHFQGYSFRARKEYPWSERTTGKRKLAFFFP